LLDGFRVNPGLVSAVDGTHHHAVAVRVEQSHGERQPAAHVLEGVEAHQPNALDRVHDRLAQFGKLERVDPAGHIGRGLGTMTKAVGAPHLAQAAPEAERDDQGQQGAPRRGEGDDRECTVTESHGDG